MKVLVTGATGFVGACLTRRLIERGDEVHIFTRENSARWRITDLVGRLVEHNVDLRDASAVERQVEAIRPSTIFHLATYGGFASQKDATAIINSNFLGTVNLLRACEKVGFDSFINTGSSSEYGIKTDPMRETDLLEPLQDYGVSKAAATLYCRSEAIEKRLPIVTLRLFSPYGPWDDPKRLIPYVLASLLKGEPSKLANPAAVRDYIFIDDVVDVYLKAAGQSLPPGEVYNVGSGRQHSIAEAVNILCNLVKAEEQPKWGAREMQRQEPTTWVADISKITHALGWAPTVGLREGLALTSDWFRANLKYY